MSDLCSVCAGTGETVSGLPCICGSCGLVMSTTPQCKPTRKNQDGQPLQGETSKLYDDVTIKESR